jgi:hypothetical protein
LGCSADTEPMMTSQRIFYEGFVREGAADRSPAPNIEVWLLDPTLC